MKRGILLIVAISLLCCIGCTKREDLVVAEVDVKKITISDFEATAEVMENKYLPLTNDLEGKKELLDHMINKEVMALKAKGAGYEKEEWFINFWEQFKGPFLVAALMDEFIRKKVEVSDKEVDDYYEKMHYEYTLSQLLVVEEEEALALREKILAGEDFNEMARKYSIGPAAEQGGTIGANVIGRIHWWVEESLFELEEGDVSEPLQTTTGFALLKVHKKRKIIPELEKSYAAKRVRAIKEKKGIDRVKKQIEKEIELQFFPQAVEIAYNALPEDVPFEDVVSYKVTRKNAPKVEIPEQYLDMIICQYVDGIYTLKDFQELYDALGLPERPRRQYGRESVVVALHKMVFDQVLPVYAEQKAKVLEIPSVKEALERKKEQFLVHRLYQDQVKDEITVPESQVKKYYDENKERMVNPEKRDFSVILTSDEKKARAASIRAKGGGDFAKLVREYSEDPAKKENMGRTGLIEKGSYPDYDEVAFALPGVGDVSDPIKGSRGWIVIKVEAIEGGGIPTFEEAYETMKKQLMEERAEGLLESKLKKWREDYIVNVEDDNLKKASLERTRI